MVRACQACALPFEATPAGTGAPRKWCDVCRLEKRRIRDMRAELIKRCGGLPRVRRCLACGVMFFTTRIGRPRNFCDEHKSQAEQARYRRRAAKQMDLFGGEPA